MIKAYKKEYEEYNNIKLFNIETNDYISYNVAKNIGFPFGIPYKNSIEDMGYSSIKECIKTLKKRNFLGKEINYKKQRESERIGLINLGVKRIWNHERIKTSDFEDIAEKLSGYGMGFVDACNVIVGNYLLEYEQIENQEGIL